MNFLKYKALIISVAAVLAAAVAILCALFIIKGGKKAVNNNSVQDSSVASASSSVSSLPSEPEPPADNGIRLAISSPAKTSVSVTDPDFTFSGTSDPAEPLTCNGAAIERGENGIFTYQVTLKVGRNTFKFEHKGESVTYTVTYRYVIIESYSPSGAQTYPSGSTIIVNVSARKGSHVTATLSGTAVELTRANETEENETDFVSYNGIINLPGNNASDLNMGKITYKATHNGKTETFTSGKITCKKSDIIVDYDPNATPSGGRYMNVGSGYIAEITEYNAETFDGNVSNQSLKDGSVDWSRPTNNYLPRGTVDYCKNSLVEYKNTKYVTLRAGYRVYLERKDKPHTQLKPVVRQYVGTLPDHNEIGIAGFDIEDGHTVLTLDSLWKAPFYFDLLPQNYVNPSGQDYRVTDVTYNYVDITFCYATVLNGEITIPEDHPLFKEAKIIENPAADGSGVRDITLRLFLKKQGAFYGWDAHYNDNGQLVFEFLNPKTVTAGENEYGTNLSGVKVLIDVGHGGDDVGAIGFGYYEKDANLKLAFKIKAELEKTGATVYMTRSDDRTSSTDDKIQILRTLKPDYCVAVHHNSSAKASPNGFGSYYSHPFAKKAAEYVLTRTAETSLYDNSKQIFKWHYYFMCRSTVCPVVLTENGFISSPKDFAAITDDAANTKKAVAITRGIVDYFNSIK